MNSLDSPPQNHAFAALRSFARRQVPVERCGMCSIQLAADHPHLIEPASHKLVCACDACAILFGSQCGTKYKRVPRRVRFLPDFRMTDAQWDGLLIPINMAFFFYNSPERKIAVFYPSPAGATESLLSLEAWNDIVQENPVLSGMEPDVEALLVNRLGRVRGYSAAEHYLLPIDECYKLVGLIRSNWKGFSGGTEVWREIGRFFGGLKERTRSGNEVRSA
ncbi:MAG: DUF5947 family protein [Terriglobia bacterium]